MIAQMKRIIGEDENKYHLYYEIREKLILVIVEKTKIGRYEDTINVVTTFYNNHILSKDVELGLAKRINQPSVRQHQLLADLPASTGSN